MRAVGVGLQVEEHRGDIASAWRAAVEARLGGEPALGYAVVPLLRELSLSLRADAPGPKGGRPAGEAFGRCAVLVRSGAEPSRLAREFALLQRTLWEVLRELGHPVSHEERREADGWLDEALAAALERVERSWMRAGARSFDRGAERAAVAVRPGTAAAGASTTLPPGDPTDLRDAAQASRTGGVEHASSPGPASRPPPLPRRSPLVRIRECDARAPDADAPEIVVETVH